MRSLWGQTTTKYYCQILFTDVQSNERYLQWVWGQHIRKKNGKLINGTIPTMFTVCVTATVFSFIFSVFFTVSNKSNTHNFNVKFRLLRQLDVSASFDFLCPAAFVRICWNWWKNSLTNALIWIDDITVKCCCSSNLVGA